MYIFNSIPEFNSSSKRTEAVADKANKYNKYVCMKKSLISAAIKRKVLRHEREISERTEENEDKYLHIEL